MFTQDEMDAVLRDAQQAVESLSEDVSNLVESDSGSTDAVPSSPAPQPPSGSAPVQTGPAQPPAYVSSPDRLRHILDMNVPLLVRLAERPMPICEIMQFSPGTILEFDRTVDSELDLMINNCQIGRGVAVKVSEHFGLRITHIGNVEQRIDSLGGG